MLKLREGAIEEGVPVTPKMGRIRFAELLQLVVDNYKLNDRHTTKDVEMRIKRHILSHFGHCRAASITAADIRNGTGYDA